MNTKWKFQVLKIDDYIILHRKMEKIEDSSSLDSFEKMGSQSSDNDSIESLSGIIEEKLPELIKQDSQIRQEFSDLQVIGSGGFGVVLKALSTKDERLYALKVIPMLSGEETKIRREVDILNLLNPDKDAHPCVLKYFKDFTLPIRYKLSPPNSAASSSSVGIVFGNNDSFNEIYTNSESSHGNRISFNEVLVIQTELCVDTLKTYLSKGEENHRNEKEILQIIDGLQSGLSYIHRKNVLHRDIKPDNVFLDQRANIKIGDFGLARHFHFETDSFTFTEELTKDVGTKSYMAPEVKTGWYGIEADVYSCGIIIFELLYHMKTDQERCKVMGKVKEEGSVPKDFKSRSVIRSINTENLMTKLIAINPANRASLLDVDKWVRRAKKSLDIKISRNTQPHQPTCMTDLKVKMQGTILMEPDDKGDNSSDDEKWDTLLWPPDNKGDNSESLGRIKAGCHPLGASSSSLLPPLPDIKDRSCQMDPRQDKTTEADLQPSVVPFKHNPSLWQRVPRDDNQDSSSSSDDNELNIMDISELGTINRIIPQ